MAILLLMAMLALIIVMMVVGGAGHQDLSAKRLEGVRAFYAAEAGVNMALREVFLGEDEDGDGGIGTIANDGNPVTNPTLPGASFFVETEIDGDFVTLTSRGVSQSARRTSKLVVETPPPPIDPIGMIAYGKSGVSRPAYRFWQPGPPAQWSAEQLANDVGDVPYWIVLRGDPTSERFALGVLGNDSRITVQIWDSASGTWSAPFVAATDAGDKTTRNFDLAFESVSGRLLLVYRRSGASAVCYRVWSEGVWSAEATVSLVPQNPRWLALRGLPGSDEIILTGSSTHSSAHTRAVQWTGGGFTNQSQFAVPGVQYEHFDVVRVGTAGDAMVVYSDGGSAAQSSYYSGGSWAPAVNLPSVNGTRYWHRLAAHHAGGEALAATLSEDERIHANVWNGSAWSSNLLVTSSAGDNNRRGFDVAYEHNSDRAILAYDSDSNTLRYRIWDGSAWSNQLNGPSGGSSPIWTIQTETGVADGEVFVMWATDNPQLRVATWNGSTFVAATLLGDSSAPKTYQPFMAAVAANEAPGGETKVLSWGEAAP